MRSLRRQLPPHLRIARPRAGRGGFTLMEVLVTLLLLAITLPAAMEVLSMAHTASKIARHRSESSALAESKLTELVATGQWQNGPTQGDFGQDWPDYTWSADVGNWDQAENMQQLRVTVSWTDSARGQESITLDTLVYLSNAAASGAGGTGTTGSQ